MPNRPSVEADRRPGCGEVIVDERLDPHALLDPVRAGRRALGHELRRAGARASRGRPDRARTDPRSSGSSVNEIERRAFASSTAPVGPVDPEHDGLRRREADPVVVRVPDESAPSSPRAPAPAGPSSPSRAQRCARERRHRRGRRGADARREPPIAAPGDERPERARTEDQRDRERRDERESCRTRPRSRRQRRRPADPGHRHRRRTDRTARCDEKRDGERESEDRTEDERVHLRVPQRHERQKDAVEVDDPRSGVAERRARGRARRGTAPAPTAARRRRATQRRARSARARAAAPALGAREPGPMASSAISDRVAHDPRVLEARARPRRRRAPRRSTRRAVLAMTPLLRRRARRQHGPRGRRHVERRPSGSPWPRVAGRRSPRASDAPRSSQRRPRRARRVDAPPRRAHRREGSGIERRRDDRELPAPGERTAAPRTRASAVATHRESQQRARSRRRRARRPQSAPGIDAPARRS